MPRKRHKPRSNLPERSFALQHVQLGGPAAEGARRSPMQPEEEPLGHGLPTPHQGPVIALRCFQRAVSPTADAEHVGSRAESPTVSRPPSFLGPLSSRECSCACRLQGISPAKDRGLLPASPPPVPFCGFPFQEIRARLRRLEPCGRRAEKRLLVRSPLMTFFPFEASQSPRQHRLPGTSSRGLERSRRRADAIACPH